MHRSFHSKGVAKGVAAIASLAALALGPAVASASLVVALDLPAMVERSDNVVVADVIAAKSSWDARHERIFTTIELSVVESWKGSAAPASRITIVQMGGTVGDDTMVVHGMSRFVPGERSVLFLRGTALRSAVVGMAQGKRLVRRTVDGGRWMVQAPDRAGAAFVKMAGTAARPSVIEMRAQPIEELRAEVQALVNSRPSRPQ